MSEIPEDVMQSARAILEAEFDDNGDRPVWGQPGQFIGMIARAILAERERCALAGGSAGRRLTDGTSLR